ncbi:MAG: hypothetical protein DLM59_18370, partial [Pseudonocardiales bacterium]
MQGHDREGRRTTPSHAPHTRFGNLGAPGTLYRVRPLLHREETPVTAALTDTTTTTLPDLDEALDDSRGISADLVRAYLNGIGRTKLLNAEQEVDLAKRIEAGLYAEDMLARGRTGEVKLTLARKRDLAVIAADGCDAKNHLLEANLRL